MIKRNLYTLLFVLLALPALKAGAQAGGSMSVSVSATVVSDSPVELTTMSNMKVTGEVNENNEIYISPIISTNAGLMRANGRPGSQARLNYIMTEVLNDENGKGTITLQYELSTNPERVQRASRLTDTGEAILNFGPDGTYYIWVGGRVNVSKASPGRYIGQFTLEIEYI